MNKEFYNMKYGSCTLLKENKNLYLVQINDTEKNFNEFIVCTYIDNMGTMNGQEFFITLKEAEDYFIKKKGDN